MAKKSKTAKKMSKTLRKASKKKKRNFYRCAWSEHYYDDLTNTVLCNKGRNGYRCECKRIWSMQFCPEYERGNLAGRWEVDAADIADAKSFKQEMEDRKRKLKEKELAEYKRLKEKYG